MSTFHVYCKVCQKRFKEEFLFDGKCPLCGKRIGLPDSLNIKTGRSFDLRLTFTDVDGNTVIKDMHDVPEAYYNQLKYVNRHVQWIEVLEEKRS